MSAISLFSAETYSSAILFRLSYESSIFNFQTSRKASPIFLLAWPPYFLTWLWVISATWFTKVITFVYKTSVESVKFLMSQKPKIAWIRWPGIIGFRSPPELIFCAMMADPASPKPKANKWLILVIACSKIAVSNVLSSFYFFLFIPPWWIISKNAIDSLSISSLTAAYGFFAINFNFVNILSIGYKTSLLASLMK